MDADDAVNTVSYTSFLEGRCAVVEGVQNLQSQEVCNSVPVLGDGQLCDLDLVTEHL